MPNVTHVAASATARGGSQRISLRLGFNPAAGSVTGGTHTVTHGVFTKNVTHVAAGATIAGGTARLSLVIQFNPASATARGFSPSIFGPGINIVSHVAAEAFASDSARISLRLLFNPASATIAGGTHTATTSGVGGGVTHTVLHVAARATAAGAHLTTTHGIRYTWLAYVTLAGGTHTVVYASGGTITTVAARATISGGVHVLRLGRKASAGVATARGGVHTVNGAPPPPYPIQLVAGRLTFAGGHHHATRVHPIVPGLKVEVAFDTDPLTVPSSWVDVTGFVREVSIRRGRSHELQRSSAGSAFIRLDNRDRRFDPTFASSPYYPNVVPMRQVRIQAVTPLATYPMFYGYVEDWGQQWPGPAPAGRGGADCVVQAVDGFKLLSLYEVSGSGVYQTAVLADNPLEYWPLEDAPGSATVADIADVGTANDLDVDPNLVTLGAMTNQGPLLGPAGVADFIGIDAAPLRITSPANYADGFVAQQTTIEFWINVDAYPPSGLAGLFSFNDGTTDPGLFAVSLTSAGGIRFEYRQFLGGGATAQVDIAAGCVTIGNWHHIVLARNLDILTCYRDGAVFQQVAFQGGVSGNAQVAPGGSLTMVVGATEDEAPPYFNGKLAHVAFYTGGSEFGGPTGRGKTLLGLEQVQAHYAARFQAGISNVAGSQIGLVLDAVGWPVALRDLDVGDSPMQALVIAGSALEAILQLGEDSELGLVQMSNDGKVTFHSRNSVLNHSTIEATFSDDGVGIPYSDLAIRYDDQDLYSVIVAQVEGGSERLVEDTAATVRYGPRTLSKTGLKLADEDEGANYAGFLSVRYAEPAMRVVEVEIPPKADTTWATLLAMDTHHAKVRVVRTPPGGGTIDVFAHVEGISWEIKPKNWRVRFQLVPAFEDAYWQLGVDAFDDETILAW